MNPLSPSAARLHPDNKFLVLPRFPSACTGLLNRMSDLVWEKRFNIVTAGRRDVAHPDAIHYEPLPYYALFKVLARLSLGPDDVFVDLGSGMGRAVCAAASFPIRAAVGVEIDAELDHIARANVARMRGRRAPIRLHHQSATDFDYSEATLLMVFNPFGPATMRTVLASLRSSLKTRPRPLRIAYINATCAHLFAAEPWLRLEDCWDMSAWSRVKTPVKFYRAHNL
jgi:predicted RNA methylase